MDRESCLTVVKPIENVILVERRGMKSEIVRNQANGKVRMDWLAARRNLGHR